MRLQNPGSAYTVSQEMERNRQIEQADGENHKRGRNIEVGVAAIILTDEITGERRELVLRNGALVLGTV